MNPLQTDIKYLKGVGPLRAKVLGDDLGITTLRDLLYHFPYKYIDRSVVHRVADLVEGMPYVQLRGQIVMKNIEGSGRSERLVALFSDGTGYVELVWFRAVKAMDKQVQYNRTYLLLGKPTHFNGRLNIPHPELEDADQSEEKPLTMQPHYHTSERMKRQGFTSRNMGDLVERAFAMLHQQPVPESLPPYLVSRYHLLPLDEALRTIHHPQSAAALPEATRRLKFEELFYLQLDILRYHRQQKLQCAGFVFERVGEQFLRFFNERLPFELTNAQKRVVREIRKDLSTGRQMNRLLQGDVGSGKTMVALLCALLAIDNQFQACIMAPTEILAEQHFVSISEYLGPLPVRVALLTGTVKGKKRKEVLQGVADGSIQLLVGTHALIEPTVGFLNLGLVIIDEQHRFGVKQRAQLWEKNIRPPHILVMTATPIPRTLGLLIYGDLDISILDELPPGRTPVKTRCITGKKRRDLYHFLDQEIGRGRQVYLVCPAIEDVPDGGLNAVKTYYEDIAKALLPDRRVGLMHGKLKPKEKAAVMEDFKSGRLDALVSTTVIEVGVDVPNASVMVIENAERYGLSALHQLRGRVGRGAAESWCFLVSDNQSENVQKRLKFLCSTTDGFAVAQYDLETRGPGDFFGSRQHGLPTLQIADLMNDTRTLHAAQSEAAAMLAEDPLLEAPEHALLEQQVQQMFEKAGAMN